MPSVVIIGAGFGGIATAIELTRHGFRDVTVLEKADSLGGVWRENTYPGAACDVPSPLYSYSFEPNPHWSMRYSPGPEILDYLTRTAAKYGVDELIRFGCEVTLAEFEDGRWRVHTASGEVLEADVLVPAMGQLSRPVLPNIEGRDSFAGVAFHSATWDHDADLTGKRVAVIGTGASAIQFIPAIQPQVEKLTVFQRTAPWILVQPQKQYRPFHHWLFNRFPVFQRFERFMIWLLVESLQKAMTSRSRLLLPLGTLLAKVRLRFRVRDRALRNKLVPDYPAGCKRVLFSNLYLPAIVRPNVEIVTEPIETITTAGVRTRDGVEHPADVLVYGTGFAATEFLAPLTIRGRDGTPLADAWAGGARAYYGMTVPGFPNMFVMYGPNTNLGSGSIIAMLEPQARYIRQAVETLARSGPAYLDLRPEVEARFDAETQSRLTDTVWTHCASWYRNETGRITNNWPASVEEYEERVRVLDPADYVLTRVSAAS
jgi:cation diffusion facilitator CzcD-associated flavoprotein CzcO